jgi:hypothetical protein
MAAIIKPCSRSCTHPTPTPIPMYATFPPTSAPAHAHATHGPPHHHPQPQPPPHSPTPTHLHCELRGVEVEEGQRAQHACGARVDAIVAVIELEE